MNINRKDIKLNLVHKVLILLLVLLAIGLFLEFRFAGSDWWRREFGQRAQGEKYIVVPQLEMEIDEGEMYRELNFVRQQLEQWKEKALRRGYLSSDELDFWRDKFVPDVDLRETNLLYIVTCDMPGMEKEQIDISVKGTVLTIKGERKIIKEEAHSHTHYYCERKSGYFQRDIIVPGRIDEQNITAEFKQGMLTVKLPKLKEEKGDSEKKVEITGF